MSQTKTQKAPRGTQKRRPKAFDYLEGPIVGVVQAAAKEFGESVEEFILGGGYLSQAADLKVLEAFLAGFPLSTADVQRMSRLARVRAVVEEEREDTMKGMTRFLELKQIQHRVHVAAELDRALAEAAQGLGPSKAS